MCCKNFTLQAFSLVAVILLADQTMVSDNLSTAGFLHVTDIFDERLLRSWLMPVDEDWIEPRSWAVVEGWIEGIEIS